MPMPLRAKALAPLLLVLAAAPAAAKAAKPQPSRSAGDGIFRIEALPTGKSVTIPRPATTQVPLAQMVRLTATDLPQSLSFRPVARSGFATGSFRIAITEGEPQKTTYADLTPGTPFLYNFKELATITVVPEAKAGLPDGVALQIESDKPLEIGH